MFNIEHLFASVQRLTSKYTEEKVDLPALAPTVIKAGNDVAQALQGFQKAGGAYNEFQEGLSKALPQLKAAITAVQKWATDTLKDPSNLPEWPKISKTVDAAAAAFPDGDGDELGKQGQAAAKQLSAALKKLVTAIEQMSKSIDKETFGVKPKGKGSGDDGLDKVRKLWTLNLDKLLKETESDLKRVEKNAADVSKDLEVGLTRENAIAA